MVPTSKQDMHTTTDFTCVYCVVTGTIFGTTDVYEPSFTYFSVSIFCKVRLISYMKVPLPLVPIWSHQSLLLRKATICLAPTTKSPFLSSLQFQEGFSSELSEMWKPLTHLYTILLLIHLFAPLNLVLTFLQTSLKSYFWLLRVQD